MTTQAITDRRPAEVDGDAWGEVLWDTATGWAVVHWTVAAKDNLPWLHTPSWVDRPDWKNVALTEIEWLQVNAGRTSIESLKARLQRIEQAVEELAK